MTDCIFCKIVRGEIPSDRVYEDEHVLAFRDINPQAPVHILVITKEHLPDLLALPPEAAHLHAAIARATQSIARDQGIAESGFRLSTNVGRDAGQVVFHLHFHIVGGRQLGKVG